jgi:hypothetical protein
MVAFLPSLSIWALAILCAVPFLKPRLPAYAFRIRGFRPKWLNRKFKAKLTAGVRLRNDNYVPIDIHALSCDIYYPDWYGSLNHIGHVHDVQQISENNKAMTSSVEEVLEATLPPLWQIEPRKTFETYDEVYLIPVYVGINALSSLIFDLFRNFGTLNVPSSMVVHVKANKKIPLTLSILCDNELNAFTLEMVGVTCEMDRLGVGWSDLSPTVADLRIKTIDGHQPGDEKRSSTVGRKPEPPNFHEEFEKASKRISWQESPMLIII